jgi:hypothetical protein
MPASLPLVLLLALPAPPVRDEDKLDPKTVVEKAIAATGGAAALKKFPGCTFKANGTFHTGAGVALACTVVAARLGPDRAATAVETADPGTPLTRALVIDRDKGWLALDGAARALSAAELAQEKERLHSVWLTTLLPLRDQAVELSSLPAVTVGKRKAVGLLVRQTGQRDVKLYFDAVRWLLLKKETTLAEGGKEVVEEVLYNDYKKAASLSYAAGVLVRRGGRRVLELQISEYTPREKLADRVFARP